MTKTNAARMLDRAGIHYELREYEVDENHLSAPDVAAAVGMPPEQVFKTLVARGDRTGVLLACIPANSELDLKALAAASGNKKVELVAMKEVLPLTGYIRGGVSPVGTSKWGKTCSLVSSFRLQRSAISTGVAPSSQASPSFIGVLTPVG